MGWRESGVQLLEGHEVRALVILVLRECMWNAPAVSLVLPAFDDTDFQVYPSCRVVYRPSVSTLITTSCFLARNGEAELKPTTFSSLLLFRFFVFLLRDSGERLYPLP